MALLDDVKRELRISSTAFDTEVLDLIESAKMDLMQSGIVETKIVETDPLIKRAIVFYCKAYFGYDNPDAQRFYDSYRMLETHLALSGDYNAT